jgi:hypothetical protein
MNTIFYNDVLEHFSESIKYFVNICFFSVYQFEFFTVESLAKSAKTQARASVLFLLKTTFVRTEKVKKMR